MTTAELLRVAPSEVEGSVATDGWLIRAFHNLVPRIPERCTGDRNESYVVVEDPRHFVDEPRDRDDLLYSGLLSRAADAGRAASRHRDGPPRLSKPRRASGPHPQEPRAASRAPRNRTFTTRSSASTGLCLPSGRSTSAWSKSPICGREIIDFARDEGFLIEERDGCFLYFCPFGTFPRSYEIVCPDIRSRLTDLDRRRLDAFAALLHRALATLGPTAPRLRDPRRSVGAAARPRERASLRLFEHRRHPESARRARPPALGNSPPRVAASRAERAIDKHGGVA